MVIFGQLIIFILGLKMRVDEKKSGKDVENFFRF